MRWDRLFHRSANFTIELVDAVTGENVFANGKYKASSIKVTDELGQNVFTKFNADDNRNTILVGINSTEGIQKLTLTIGENLTVPIHVKVRLGTGGCCSNYFTEDVAVQGYKTEVVKETGIIKIKI
jgi:hypothetical protein